MDRAKLETALLDVIREILTDSDMPVPELADEVCPVDIAGFDSQTWPYAMAEVADRVGIEIPLNRNIFFSLAPRNPKSKKRTIREIVDVLVPLAKHEAA